MWWCLTERISQYNRHCSMPITSILIKYCVSEIGHFVWGNFFLRAGRWVLPVGGYCMVTRFNTGFSEDASIHVYRRRQLISIQSRPYHPSQSGYLALRANSHGLERAPQADLIGAAQCISSWEKSGAIQISKKDPNRCKSNQIANFSIQIKSN